jgi:S-adenosylmethionine hydrolase
MIVLFTDFGLQGPYTGQMKAVLCQMAPDIPAVDLFADARAGRQSQGICLLVSGLC